MLVGRATWQRRACWACTGHHELLSTAVCICSFLYELGSRFRSGGTLFQAIVSYSYLVPLVEQDKIAWPGHRLPLPRTFLVRLALHTAFGGRRCRTPAQHSARTQQTPIRWFQIAPQRWFVGPEHLSTTHATPPVKAKRVKVCVLQASSSSWV